MNDYRQRRVPDFLGIGAPRSGSTWLHVMLSRHPDVYVPPIKEVHYFDSMDASINESFKINSFFGRYKKLSISRLRHYFGYMASPLVRSFRDRAKPDPAWDLRFFSPGGDVKWYINLFKHATQRYRSVGEITPAYIMLSEEVIRTIHDTAGVRKIVVILRDPISATWSCIEKQVRDAGGPSDHNVQFDDDAILKRIRSPQLFARYDYAKNLSNWLKYYDRSQVFIGFYEELETNPQGLLSRVLQFLEVEDISSQLIGVEGKVVNAARGMLGVIPDAARTVLAQMHSDQLEKLADMVQGPAIHWKAEAQSILQVADDA